ncbi:MAG: F0F1 ATP synthase subunit B [Phycisphaerales bacterium JB037]
MTTLMHLRSTRAAVAASLIALAPTLAAAAEEGGANPIPSGAQAMAPAIAALVVFAVVFTVLATAVWPKILKGLNERADKIREEIASAEAARKQAKDALDEYEANLAEARAEAKSMLEQTKADQAKLAQELKAKAEAEAAQLRERAMRDIESAKRSAINELYADAANLATLVAGKILAREISADDQTKLVEESLAELQGSRN